MADPGDRLGDSVPDFDLNDEAVRDAMYGPFGMRFLSRFRKDAGGCWIWTAAHSSGGYGQIARNGKNIYAHRVSYEMFVGPIPAGMYICHTCDTPACVNPAHLFAGTQRDNAIDMSRKGRWGNQSIGKTHCIRGHLLAGENLCKTTDGSRNCRTCRNSERRRKRAEGKVA